MTRLTAVLIVLCSAILCVWGQRVVKSGYWRYKGREKYNKLYADDGQVWMFHIGNSWGPYEYIDDEGYLQGFSVDLIQAVCKQARRHCHYMLDRYASCWQDFPGSGRELPGQGLQDGWYDGCMSWLPTPTRINSFKFSKPYTQTAMGKLWYRKDDSFLTPGNRDLTGKKIGFVSLWAISKNCLDREMRKMGADPTVYTAVYFDDIPQMRDALANKQIDAMWSAQSRDHVNADELGFLSTPESAQCAIQGMSVMSRYGSRLPLWWNDAFDELRKNGGYAKLCKESSIKHASRGKLWCLDEWDN